MRIALINEKGQSPKNQTIAAILEKVAGPLGHQVDNYGMYGPQDLPALTYVQCGILGAILLNSGAADFVVTGCRTGAGAMLAMNSFPGVLCGHVEDPVDAYTFAQMNAGNAVAIPFAKGYGWGGELNLEYIFEKLFAAPRGQGYPREEQEPQQRNKEILDQVRQGTYRPFLDCLQSLDRELLRGAVGGPRFQQLFFPRCQDPALAAYLRTLL